MKVTKAACTGRLCACTANGNSIVIASFLRSEVIPVAKAEKMDQVAFPLPARLFQELKPLAMLESSEESYMMRFGRTFVWARFFGQKVR